MGTFIVYMIKSSICLILFYLFFRLFLSKDTFHRFNRIALLSLMLLAFLIPVGVPSLRPFSATGQEVVKQENRVGQKEVIVQIEAASPVQTSSLHPAAKTPYSWIIMLMLVYPMGMVFCFSRQLRSMFRMFKLMGMSRTEYKGQDCTILVHSHQISPFSWMKYIVISEKDLEENRMEIITHELAHIQKKHSWDLIAADICILFQWFNPAAWLLKQEIQSIHEFEADDRVLNKGIDAKQYQLLLIKKAVGTSLYSLANSLNHSSLKKRITMMLKEKSNPWARLKYLFLLPLVCITMFTFASPDVSRMEKLSTEKVNDLMVLNPVEKSTVENQSADKVNENSGYGNFGEVKKVEDQSHSVLENLLALNDEAKSSAQKSTIKLTEPVASTLSVSGTVLSSTDKQPLSAVSVIAMDNSDHRIVETVTKDDGTFELVTKASIHTLTFSHIGYKSTVWPVKDCKTVQMDEATQTLHGVTVIGYAPLKSKIESQKASSQGESPFLIEKMPEYPGGQEALIKYISESLRYPPKAIDKKSEGRVVCSFVVNADGEITDVRIVTPVDPLLDKEALRIVVNMPSWIPGKQNGENCSVKYSIPIQFGIKK